MPTQPQSHTPYTHSRTQHHFPCIQQPQLSPQGSQQDANPLPLGQILHLPNGTVAEAQNEHGCPSQAMNMAVPPKQPAINLTLGPHSIFSS